MIWLNEALLRLIEVKIKCLFMLQKEIAQKDRQLQQHQPKLEESVCKLNETNHHRVEGYSNIKYKA